MLVALNDWNNFQTQNARAANSANVCENEMNKSCADRFGSQKMKPVKKRNTEKPAAAREREIESNNGEPHLGISIKLMKVFTKSIESERYIGFITNQIEGCRCHFTLYLLHNEEKKEKGKKNSML